jgi:hypothetical protein
LTFCYLDEAGDTGVLPTATSPVQPLFCILGLTLDAARLKEFTLDFLDLKHRFFPNRFRPAGTRLGRLLVEIKGSDLRAVFRTADRRLQRHHIRLFRGLLALLNRHQCRIFGRVWVKPIGGPMDGHAVYSFSTQSICTTLQNLLNEHNDTGLVIADSRTKAQNSKVSFSVFTQHFCTAGSPYSRVLETPTFGHSENHAGLQACDWLCSGLLFPLAAYAFCAGHVNNVHVHTGYAVLKNEFGPPIKDLQHRFRETGRWRGGIVVSDEIDHKPGWHLFV